MITSRNVAVLLFNAAVLSGCSDLPHISSRPSEIEISVISPDVPCSSLPEPRDIQLRISNHGHGTFRTDIDTTPGPPYQLSWLSYAVLNMSLPGDHVEWKHGPGGHGPLPQNELAIGPDDSTIVYARLYGVGSMNATGPYRIQIRDEDRQIYMSNEFGLCRPDSDSPRPSNPSFKPTSLRDAA